MRSQKIIIIFESFHHNNTKKIAQVISQGLQAELYKPEQVDLSTLADFECIGIGSGIYFGKPHENIQRFLAQLPYLQNRKSFLFTTSGMQNPNDIQLIRNAMESKGLKIMDFFSCRGLNTHGPLKLVGGTNKGHPDLKDLQHAEIFARNLLNGL